MSQYVTKRAQEAAELVAGLETAYEAALVDATERQNELEASEEALIAAKKRVSDAHRGIGEAVKESHLVQRDLHEARLRLEATLRTEHIVAAGDAVDVGAVLDGAL